MGHYTLCDLVADITQNSAEAGAELVELEIRETHDEFRFTLKDNGKGMTPEELARARDPFVTDGVKHPRRKVGLGIPFLIQTAEQSGGGCSIESQKGKGTVVSAWFDMNNVDTPPVGDIPSMARSILLFAGPGEIVLRRSLKTGAGDRDYEVRKTELVEALGDLEDAESLSLMGRYLRSAETEDG
ncbi:MAG: sensor histidine kinase [Spirochaetaceae bacterium]|jgi:hypothetical protein|nr:sensor histidine kinase [Spirochaetaceae bacterium]